MQNEKSVDIVAGGVLIPIEGSFFASDSAIVHRTLPPERDPTGGVLGRLLMGGGTSSRARG
jgi:hypothetical protein